MDVGRLVFLDWAWLLVVLPAVSLVHCAAIVAATWFALGQGRLPLRALSLAAFCLFSAVLFLCFGKGAGHVVSAADIAIPTLWLLAKSNGLSLERDGANIGQPNQSPAIQRGQFSLRFLFWLPFAFAFVFTFGPPPAIYDGLHLTLMVAESLGLASVFLTIIYVMLKPSPPRRLAICGFVLLVPFAIFFTLFNIGHVHGEAAGLVLPLCFGSPLLTGVLLLARNKGLRLFWKKGRWVKIGLPAKDWAAKADREPLYQGSSTCLPRHLALLHRLDLLDRGTWD